MKQLISFSKFLALPKDIQEQLSTFENEYLEEELSPPIHKKKMVELEKRLKGFDFWYSRGDNQDWKKGRKEEEAIYALRQTIGKDADALYDMYAKKSGMNEELSNKLKSTKLNLLSKMLQGWDYKYVNTDKKDGYKKGVAQEKEIIKLYKEIGAEGLVMYRDFLKSKGMKEARKDSRLTPYDKHIHKHMAIWKLTTLDELEGEAISRFWKEVDDSWDGDDDVEVNLPESIFPEIKWEAPTNTSRSRY